MLANFCLLRKMQPIRSCVLVLWMAGSLQLCCGQTIVPPPIPPEATSYQSEHHSDSPPLVLPELQQSDIPSQYPAVPMQPPGFWIVSTHQSPQSFDHACPKFCPGVTRFDQCVGYRQSSLAELCQSLQPGIPVCITVHGSFVDWESVCTESRCAWQWLQSGCPDRPLQVICFTWPSDRIAGPLIQLDIAVLGRRASRNGFYLADLIRHLPVESPVSLVGHSHGTRVIASGLHLMGGGTVEDLAYPWAAPGSRRIRAVFAASAIDHDWLNPDERFGRALCSAECILNLKNNHDPALKVYPLRRPFSSRALGFSGFTSKDRRELQSWSHKVADLDVSSQIGHAHLWPEYFTKPWLARSISNYTCFPDYACPTCLNHNNLTAANIDPSSPSFLPVR